MQTACGQVLAGAGFAVQKHIDIQWADARNRRPQVSHDLRTADKLTLRIADALNLAPQRQVFELQPALFKCPAGRVDQVLRFGGFLDEVIGVVLHRLDRGLHVTVCRNDDEGDLGGIFLDQAQKLHAGSAGHANIADDDAVPVGLDLFGNHIGVGVATHAEPGELERFLHCFQQIRIIVDQNDFARFKPSAQAAPPCSVPCMAASAERLRHPGRFPQVPDARPCPA